MLVEKLYNKISKPLKLINTFNLQNNHEIEPVIIHFVGEETDTQRAYYGEISLYFTKTDF